MKILIVTGNFYPELHPRAFRATELAVNFANKGHDVTVCLLRSVIGFDYEKYANEKNIIIENLSLYKQTGVSRELQNTTNSFALRIWKYYRLFLSYFLSGSLFINAFKIKKRLKLTDDLDLIISISYPFMNHLAVAMARKKIKNLRAKFIADSGDPFFRSQQTKKAPYFFIIEKNTYKQFDYLTVPEKASIDAYKGLISHSKIKIIPQGFNMENIKLATFKKSNKITFAYAGVFYDDIRNPEFLFDYLVKINIDFRFDIYLRHKDSVISNILEPYIAQLGDKITITYAINRDDLLYNLSSVDFLINIGNLTTTQIPSKLIDYAITKRPIFSCNSINFDKEKFNQFLNRDYSTSLKIDIKKYNINTITNQFLQLLEE